MQVLNVLPASGLDHCRWRQHWRYLWEFCAPTCVLLPVLVPGAIFAHFTVFLTFLFNFVQKSWEAAVATCHFYNAMTQSNWHKDKKEAKLFACWSSSSFSSIWEQTWLRLSHPQMGGWVEGGEGKGAVGRGLRLGRRMLICETLACRLHCFPSNRHITSACHNTELFSASRLFKKYMYLVL